MPECSLCGEQVSMPFTCKFCEESFCSHHRLPENHDCDGLRDYTDEARGEGKIGYDVMHEDESDAAAAAAGGRPGRDLADRAIALLPDDLTLLVLGLLFAVFALTIAGGREVFAAFALDPARVAAEPWRLVTSIFMHAGLAHLLVNSIVLYSFGPHVQRMVGKKRFLTVLFVPALASSLGFAASGLLFDIGPAVGISGGLYGMVAFLAVTRPQITVLAFFFVPLSIRHAVMFFGALDAVNFLAHTMGIYLPLIGGFASAGHLSGLIAGLALGWYWREEYRQPTRQVLFEFGPSRA